MHQQQTHLFSVVVNTSSELSMFEEEQDNDDVLLSLKKIDRFDS